MAAQDFDELNWAKGDTISVCEEHSEIAILPVIGIDFKHRTVLVRWRTKERSVLCKNIVARIRRKNK